MVLPFVVGCTFGVSEPTEEELAEEPIGTAQSAVTAVNALWPNMLNPNGLLPNGMLPNSLIFAALDPNEIPSTAMDALQDPGQAGELSRMLMKYIVSCALNTGRSFDFSWIDIQSTPHHESFPGELGLASDWVDEPPSTFEQAWVSSCLAARTNYFGVSVMISMRGSDPALGTTGQERLAYTHREGAFFGNLFAIEPSVKACYHANEVAYSRSKQRVCATGYDDGVTVYECGILDTIGDCADFCTLAPNPEDGYTQCEQTFQVITAFLD
jgi:hypothetical protein